MKRSVILLMFLIPAMVVAEPVYIDDKLMVGLHQDKSVDSPILKVLPGGTTLEIVRRDTPLSQVKDPGGSTGWIDNKYLTDAAPGRTQLQTALDQISKLEAEIASLKSATVATAPTRADDVVKITKENEELKQLLKSERLRIGELQTQTAELRNKLAKSNGGDSDLIEQLDTLTREKAELEKELGKIQTGAQPSQEKVKLDIGEFDWKRMLISIAVSLLAGFIAGLLLLDWMNRRRHGGFRI